MGSESFEVPEMVKVGHGQKARTGRTEDFEQEPVHVLEFRLKLIEQQGVILAPRGGGLKGLGDILQRARE